MVGRHAEFGLEHLDEIAGAAEAGLVGNLADGQGAVPQKMDALGQTVGLEAGEDGLPRHLFEQPAALDADEHALTRVEQVVWACCRIEYQKMSLKKLWRSGKIALLHNFLTGWIEGWHSNRILQQTQSEP